MATSDAGHLADVNAAITATLNGQVSSYSIESRSLQRFPLAELFDIRDRLQAAINKSAGSSIRVAKFVRPSQ